jgi:hypothetical protein
LVQKAQERRLDAKGPGEIRSEWLRVASDKDYQPFLPLIIIMAITIAVNAKTAIYGITMPIMVMTTLM